tara:strand:+ start:296 stop:595 length:300 start_codon:yes stop_codon:yes gene_type:complete
MLYPTLRFLLAFVIAVNLLVGSAGRVLSDEAPRPVKLERLMKIPDEYRFQEGRDFARVMEVVEEKGAHAPPNPGFLSSMVRALLCGVAKNVSGPHGCLR